MSDVFATSFGVLNYSGALFNKGNTRTPLSSAIGGRAKTTNHVEFVTGQEYTGGGTGTQPAISETASLTAPYATVVTRSQKTNVTQIFQEAFGISYAKESNMGTLSGVNIANQLANPISELDFQVAARLQKVQRDIEYTFINGVYAKAADDNTANKTRGLVTAVTSNVIAMGGKALGLWDVADLQKKVYEANAQIQGLVLWCDAVTLFQLNADAKNNGLTVIPAAREVNGIKLSSLLTPLGEVYLYLGECLPAGTALLLNLDVIGPVYQPVPEKGNFFLEELAKTGAGKKFQLFGQIGLDHGPEWYHGKLTGISTAFVAPPSAMKVYIESPVPTVEVDAVMTGVTLDVTDKVTVGENATATPLLNIAPGTAGTFAYEWQSCATATGTFAADNTLTGYNTATVTAPAEVPAKKYIRCKVTASGSVEAGTLYSPVIEIAAAPAG